jgi:hypothetical protein
MCESMRAGFFDGQGFESGTVKIAARAAELRHKFVGRWIVRVTVA